MLILYIFTLSIILLSMVLSLAEASVVGFSRYKACNLIKQDLYGAKSLLVLDERKTEVLSTIIMLNTAVNIGGSMGVGMIASDLLSNKDYGIFVCVLTLSMLLFSEIKPKVFASGCPEKVARFLAAPLLILTTIFRPLTWFIQLIIGGKSKTEALTEHEVRAIMTEAKQSGLFGASEAKVVTNMLNLRNIKTEKVLTTDGAVVTVDISSTVAMFEEEAVGLKYKRIVAVNKHDMPVGVVLVSDILLASVKGRKDACIAEFIYPMTSVGKDCFLSDLLVKLFRSQTHIAVVVDNDGALVGVVTLSNVIEVLMRS